MNISYADESGYTGTGRLLSQPVLVVGGVLVNTHSAPKVKRAVADLHQALEDIAGSSLDELKTSDLVRGSGQWSGVSVEDRKEARDLVLSFIDTEKLKIAVSGVLYSAFDELESADAFTPYSLAAVRYAIAVQRYAHRARTALQNKSVTLCVFDHLQAEEATLSRLLGHPPSEVLAAAGGKLSPQTPGLSALWDASLFADSIQAPLIQVADFVAFFFRRWAELGEGLAERFDGEGAIVDDVLATLTRSMISPDCFKLGRGPFADAVRLVTPSRFALRGFSAGGTVG